MAARDMFGLRPVPNRQQEGLVLWLIISTQVQKRPVNHILIALRNTLIVVHITGTAEDRKGGDSDQRPLNVEIQELPSYRVAYIRDVGPYWSESNREAFLRLMQWAVAAGAATDPSAIPIAVGWSDPATTPPDDCIFDACIPVSGNIKGNGDIRIQHLPGGAFAILRCECSWERLFWESNRLFYEWLPLSVFRRDKRPFFFKCYNNPDMNPRKLAIVDVCLPIKL